MEDNKKWLLFCKIMGKIHIDVVLNFLPSSPSLVIVYPASMYIQWLHWQPQVSWGLKKKFKKNKKECDTPWQGGTRNTHYPGMCLVSVSVRTEERVQPFLYLLISTHLTFSHTNWSGTQDLSSQSVSPLLHQHIIESSDLLRGFSSSPCNYSNMRFLNPLVRVTTIKLDFLLTFPTVGWDFSRTYFPLEAFETVFALLPLSHSPSLPFPRLSFMNQHSLDTLQHIFVFQEMKGEEVFNKLSDFSFSVF